MKLDFDTRCQCGHRCLAHAWQGGPCFVTDCPCQGCVHPLNDDDD